MTIWRLLVVALLSFGLVGCDRFASDPAASQNPNGTVSPGKTRPDAAPVSLTINQEGTDKSSILTEVPFRSGMTVIGALETACQDQGLELDFSGKGETAFVKSIGGIVGGDQGRGWWIYYVNSKLAHQGAGVFELKEGDQIEWRLGTYTGSPATSEKQNGTNQNDAVQNDKPIK